jgi:hypothetical protein
MSKEVVHAVPDFVEVSYRPELNAVYLKWFSEYDETTRVRDAVMAALDYVRTNGIENWVADVSTSPLGLSDADYRWVSGEEFRQMISSSPLRKFVLIPPLPETGQDTAWVSDWEANTLAKFGGKVTAKVCENINEVRSFLKE